VLCYVDTSDSKGWLFSFAYLIALPIRILDLLALRGIFLLAIPLQSVLLAFCNIQAEIRLRTS